MLSLGGKPSVALWRPAMRANSVPTSKLARSSVTGAALLKVGGKHLTHAAKRPFLSKPARKKHKEDLDDETAKLIFSAFSQLRGTALKIAQMLALETHFLPEAFRKELSKSYHQAPTLGRPLVRKVMQRELGQSADQLFSEFDSQAFAAASLGQVHHARDLDGRVLAVKLQYPGIDISIDSDVQLARTLIKRTPYSKLLLSSLKEIEARLKEEVDYFHEAENTEWFRRRLKLDRVVIPRVYPALSTRRILTTDRLKGLHLDQWLATRPSQQTRNHFAQLLYDIFVHCFYDLHALHADPNPGNYLFADDGRLGLLDFGCVRHFTAEFVATLPKLLRAYMDDDAARVMAIYERLGMAGEVAPAELEQFYRRTLQPFGQWITQPFQVEVFDFKNHSSSYTFEGREVISQLAKVKTVNNLANEFIFFDRTIFGLYQIFERMGAQVRMQHRWLA